MFAYLQVSPGVHRRIECNDMATAFRVIANRIEWQAALRAEGPRHVFCAQMRSAPPRPPSKHVKRAERRCFNGVGDSLAYWKTKGSRK